MVSHFHSRCITIPTGRQVRQQSGNTLSANTAHVARLDNDITAAQRENNATAQRELSNPQITPQEASSILSQMRGVEDSARQARRDLAETLQACIDFHGNFLPLLYIGEFPIASLVSIFYPMLKDKDMRSFLVYMINEKYAYYKSKLTTLLGKFKK